MTIWISTNGRKSNGAKELSAQPGFRRCVTGKGVKAGDTVVNWGSSQPVQFAAIKILNPGLFVALASDKLEFFEYLFGPESNNPVDSVFVKTVEWTTNRVNARAWSQEGSTVVVRHKLKGHSGDGIEIVEPGHEVPEAPLYTKYIFKEKEFRIHVVGGKVIDTQRKIKDPDKEVVTWKVRSHANGFIFARNGIEASEERDKLAIAAMKAIMLDFGAVDIIQDKQGVYYVLEINTAPGLEGLTIELYSQAFKELVNG